ncbi:MAG TPA: hypothetical protein VI522_07870, partial [Gammaproteobacteria bacterium]|nr:hypothetical protein [Gammaproteobacteria bacterium]
SSFAIPGGEPQGVAFDDTGRLFVSSTDSNIYVYSLPGTLVMTLKSAGDPYQMTFDSDDNLIVASCAPPRLFTYNPPFFNNQTPNVTTVTADCVGGVSTIEGGSGEVLLVTTNTSDLYAYFPLPLTSGSVAVVYDGSAFTAEWGFNLAHDKVNNVYVPDFANGEMDVFGANDPDPSTFNVLGYTPGGVAVQ